MFTHRRSVCVSRACERPPNVPRPGSYTARYLRVGSWVAVLSCPLLALSARGIRAAEIDAEHLFGFTIGSDIGAKGEKEIESETSARTGKGSGSYTAVSEQIEAKHTLSNSFRIAIAAAFACHDMSGAPGLSDRGQAAFQGLSFDARYRLLDRERSFFGLSVSVEPHWNRIDDITGASVESYGSTLIVAIDKELLANKLYAAVNILHDPEVTRFAATHLWMRQSTIGISGAFSVQIKEGVFLGAEVRSLHQYDGLGFNSFAGRALFGGPTFYARLSEHWWTSFAWNTQIAGRAAEQPGTLDLVNFEHHRAKLRIGYHF